jgi:hypothetical protein
LKLTPGMRLRLPSGLIVTLVSCDGDDWTCAYAQRARGEVTLAGRYLRNRCTVC